MAIKVFVALEGAEDIAKQVEEITKSVTGLADSVNNVGGDTGGAKSVQDISLFFGNATQAANAHRESVGGVTEAYHILAPILREAGVSFQEMRGFAILARAGLEGLALAASGAIVLSLAKLEDQAAQTRVQLDALFGSKTLGGQAFDALKQSATDLSTTVEAIAPGFEALVEAWNKFVESTRSFKFVSLGEGALPGLPPGMAGSVESLTAAYDNLFKLLRAGGDTTAQATSAIQTFFTSIQQTGKITADALQKLPTGTVQLLAQAFGRGVESAQAFINQVKLAPIPLDQALVALQRFGPQSQQAFDATAIKTFGDALQEILTTLQEGFKSIAGVGFSQFVITEFEKINIVVRATFEGLAAFKEFLAKPALTGFSDLNAKFKEIDDNMKKALQDLTDLQDQAAKPTTVKFVIAPTTAEGQAPPGSAIVPGTEVPLPQAKPPELLALQQQFIDLPALAQDAMDKVGNILAQTTGKAGFLPSVEEAQSSLGTIVDEMTKKWNEFLAVLAKGTPGSGGGELSPAQIVQQDFAELQPVTIPAPTLAKPSEQAIKDVTQPIIDQTQQAHDDVKAIWDQPSIDPTKLLSGTSDVQTQFGSFVNSLIEKWNEFKRVVEQGIISPAGAAELQPPPVPLPVAPLTPTAQGAQDITAQKAQADALAETVAGIDQAWTSVDDSITEGTDLISVMAQGISGVSDTISGLVSAFETLASAIAQAAQNAQQLLQALIDLSAQQVPNVGSGGGFQGAAEGGLIRGVGTPTSDSNLIWASVNEFMQPARAVQYYGVSFMEAVRNLQLPRDLWRGMRIPTIPIGPGFAGGGLIGAKNTLRPIVLNIAGKGSFAGTIDAPDSVVNQLGRESVFEQLAAGGRSPGWRRS